MAANCAAREFAARPVGGTQYSGNAQGADHERTASRYGTRYHRPRHTQPGQSPRTGGAAGAPSACASSDWTPSPIFPKWRKRAPLLKKTPCSRPAKFPSAPALSPLPTIPGLEVDALNGAPGVYSARYSEDMPDLPGATKDERNTMKLLAACRPCGCGTVRRASAASSPSVRPKAKPLAPGTWEGSVACSPRGKNGFGYDPVFLDPELGLTAAEMSPEEKMSRSHRAKALRELLRLWPSFWEGVSPEESLTFPRPTVTLGLTKTLLKEYTDAHGKDGFSTETALVWALCRYPTDRRTVHGSSHPHG